MAQSYMNIIQLLGVQLHVHVQYISPRVQPLLRLPDFLLNANGALLPLATSAKPRLEPAPPNGELVVSAPSPNSVDRASDVGSKHMRATVGCQLMTSQSDMKPVI